jgi:hypothetical protein
MGNVVYSIVATDDSIIANTNTCMIADLQMVNFMAENNGGSLLLSPKHCAELKNCLMFMYAEPGVKYDFGKKTNTLVAIDIVSGKIQYSGIMNHGYSCRYDRPTEIVIQFEPGGRIVNATSGRVHRFSRGNVWTQATKP